jgi:PmbA protein
MRDRMTDENPPTAKGPDAEALAQIGRELVDAALKAGAEAAEAALVESRSLEASVREGSLEGMERSESRDAGLRVFIGKKQAGVAFSDLSPAGLATAVERAVAMARLAPEDPYAGLVEREALARSLPEIPLYEAHAWDAERLEAVALEMEAAAMAVPGVTATAGAGASYGAGASALVTSTGFEGLRRASSASLAIAPIAKKNGLMERDYESSAARRLGDLKSPSDVGRIAGERAAARVGAEKVASGKMPVVFDRRAADDILGYLLGAISGPAIARGTSFLREKMGERIFAEGIDVIEDPLKPWGFGSRAHDGEGVAARPRAIIEDGMLTTWLLNASSARQLGLDLTGHASPNLGAPPGVGASNVHLAPGGRSRAELISDAGTGLLVMEMFGASLNANTGDWSVGVAGFAIKDGSVGHPTSEITVAGNVLDIFARLEPGSDLEFDSAVVSPSILVDGLSVGGR